MVTEFQKVLFPLIENFKKEGGLEWIDSLKELNQEELVDTLEAVHETVKNLIYHASLLPGVTEKERETLIGKLAIQAAHLFHAPGRYNDTKLQEVVKSFEEALRNIARPEWIEQAKKQYPEFEKVYEEAEEEEEIAPKDIDRLRSVLFALDLFEIISFDPSAEEEYGEEVFEFEDDDYEENEEGE